MLRELITLAFVVLAATREASPYDSTIDDDTLCETSMSPIGISVTQLTHTSAKVMMNSAANWTFAWLEDNHGSVMTLADESEGTVYETNAMTWASQDWTSTPTMLLAKVRFSDCTLATSDDLWTWHGVIDNFVSTNSQYNPTDLPEALQDMDTWNSYTPTTTLTYAEKRLSYSAQLGDGNATNYVPFVYVADAAGDVLKWHSFDAGDAGAAWTLGSNVVFPPLTTRVSVCSAVVYTLECATIDLSGELVAEMEAAHPPEAQPAAVAASVGSLAADNTTRVDLVRATSCDEAEAVNYMYARINGVIVGHNAGTNMLGVTAAGDVDTLDAYAQCGEQILLSSIDVAALRDAAYASVTPYTPVTCEQDGVAHDNGVVIVNAVSGANCTCGEGEWFCATGLPTATVSPDAGGNGGLTLGVGVGLGVGIPALVLSFAALIWMAKQLKLDKPLPPSKPVAALTSSTTNDSPAEKKAGDATVEAGKV